MRPRIRTLEDVAWLGLRLRVWCYGCARARELDGGTMLQLFVERDWPVDLASARARFRCDLCQSKDGALLVPASPPRPDPPPAEREEELPWARQVKAFFHGSRKRRKEGVMSPEVALTLEMLNRPKPAPPKRTPPRRGHLRLVKGGRK